MTKQEYLEKALEFFKTNYPEEEPKINEKEFAIIVKDGMNIILNTPYLKALESDFNGWDNALKTFYEVNRNILEQTTAVTTWEDAKDKILPQIKTKAQLEHAINIAKDYAPDPEDLIVYKDFIGDLAIAWVIDSPKGFLYITKKMLGKFNKTTDDLNSVAIANLGELPGTETGPKTIKMHDGSASLIWETSDGYDAARILLPSFYEIFRRRLGDMFLVGIPHRDILIVVASDFKTSLSGFIVKEFNQSSHPVSSQIIEATPTGLGVLESS